MCDMFTLEAKMMQADARRDEGLDGADNTQ